MHGESVLQTLKDSILDSLLEDVGERLAVVQLLFDHGATLGCRDDEVPALCATALALRLLSDPQS